MRPTSAPIVTPPESGCQVNAAMKAPVADTTGKDAAPSGAACDIRAPIYFCAVTRGSCRRVRPIISCPFATDTMSTAPPPTGGARPGQRQKQRAEALYGTGGPPSDSSCRRRSNHSEERRVRTAPPSSSSMLVMTCIQQVIRFGSPSIGNGTGQMRAVRSTADRFGIRLASPRAHCRRPLDLAKLLERGGGACAAPRPASTRKPRDGAASTRHPSVDRFLPLDQVSRRTEVHTADAATNSGRSCDLGGLDHRNCARREPSEHCGGSGSCVKGFCWQG